eukprot:c5413_g1_i2 orf=416-694(+)
MSPVSTGQADLHCTFPSYSSLPSQQSQMPSFTLDEKTQRGFCLWLLQKNLPLGHADVPGSSVASGQSQKSSFNRSAEKLLDPSLHQMMWPDL